MHHLLEDHSVFIHHVVPILYERSARELIFSLDGFNLAAASAVLFLLGEQPGKHRNSAEPCVILNKRSVKVKQPGDLCCPGGSIMHRLDFHLAKLFKLPFLSLAKWPYWRLWRQGKPQAARFLALLWATGLREGFEEMRLNPFGLKFLGLLPPQSLVMFDRVIYPMVAWINRQNRFYPNWEVEKIVYIPLRNLLDPENYACYRLSFNTRPDPIQTPTTNDFPCFRHRSEFGTELLWGATYRITTVFLEYVFNFRPPAVHSMQVLNGSLNHDYLTGQR